MTEQRYVGCDPSIYDAGGFQDLPHVLEQIRADSLAPAPDLSVVATLYPSAARTRTLDRATIFAPDAVFAKLAEGYAHAGGDHPVVPACALVRLANALVLDRAIYLERDGQPRALYETQRPCDRPYLRWTDPTGAVEDLPDDQDYLLLSSAGTFNWGHWLIDDLTRLRALTVRAARRRPLCILMHAYHPYIDEARRDMLETLLGPRSAVTVRMLSMDRTYRVPTLFFASPVSNHPAPKHPAALADLAKAGARVLARRWWRPERRRRGLIVTRRPERGRVPENWEALCERLTARGFQVFDTERPPARAQIAAFAGAERVIGCMGAAMANTVFCRPGTRVLHLAPETFPEPFYHDLATARGHGYGACYGTALDASKGAMANYRLDPGLLERALDWLCAPA